MEQAMRYETGRNYGTPQVIDITVPTIPADADLCDTFRVTFADQARNISGTVHLMTFECSPLSIGPAVLREYDAGRYTETV